MSDRNFGYLSYASDNLEKARALRKNMTRQEKRLWYDFLHDYPVKVYRQRRVGNYIADFYCPSAKLVIELDGSQHYTDEEMEYDRRRTLTLEKCGLRVIRFLNADVDLNFVGVCEQITKKIAEKIGR